MATSSSFASACGVSDSQATTVATRPVPTPQTPRCLWADLSDEEEEDFVCQSTSTPWEWLSADSFEEDMDANSSCAALLNTSSSSSSSKSDLNCNGTGNSYPLNMNMNMNTSIHLNNIGQSSGGQGVGCRGIVGAIAPLTVAPVYFPGFVGATHAFQPQTITSSHFGASPKEDGCMWASSSSSMEAYTPVATGMCPLPSSSPASWSVGSFSLDAPNCQTVGQGVSPASNCVEEAVAPALRRFRIKNQKLQATRSTEGSESPQELLEELAEHDVPAPPAPPAKAKPNLSFRTNPKGEGEWSMGSAKHDIGRCRRCLFYDSPVGCIKGAKCDFCHLAHFRSSCTRPSKAKRDRYARLFQDIAEKRAKKAQALAEASGAATQSQQ